MKHRSNFYIDGFNLYYGIKKSGDKTLLWLDIVGLCKKMIRSTEQLHHIHYFTAIPKHPNDKVRRHHDFLKLLKSLDHPIIIHKGRFIKKPVECHATCKEQFYTYEEKMSDVAFGCQMVHDAHMNDCENMYLITGDGDLLPAIEIVKAHYPKIKIEVLFPPNRQSHILMNPNIINYKDSLSVFTLAKFRMPEKVTMPNGKNVMMPKIWRTESSQIYEPL